VAEQGRCHRLVELTGLRNPCTQLHSIQSGLIADQKETKWNRWSLRMLAAEGYLFTGERERAIEAAKASVWLMRHQALVERLEAQMRPARPR